MSGERGPIVRRRRASDGDPKPPETAAPASPKTSGADGTPAPEPKAPSSSRDDGPRARPARPVIGRRAYDPQADRNRGPKPAPSGAALSPDGARKPKKFGARPSPSQEKLALRAKAQTLSKEKNVPLIHAYRILKGQTTLNEVLKSMMRKERFEQMVTREGIDRELAGQVAAGHLSKQRALLLTRMRTLRTQKLHVDGIKAAEMEKHKVALDLFGHGWVVGRVRNVRPYEFDFFAEGADKSERYYKHDVKAMCPADDIAEVAKSVAFDEAIQAEGLAATDDRSARIRPDDETLLLAIENNRVVRMTLRDGEIILGRVRSFGRWDVELFLDSGALVTVFFHGLHATSRTLGYSS